MTSLSWVVADFETASGCDLEEAGAWRYAEDVTTEVICFGYKKQGWSEGKLWRPGDDTAELMELVLDESLTWIAHNAAFEKAIWRNIMMPLFGFPDIPNSRWHDTMATCAMRVIPMKLEGAATALRLHIQKDKEGSALAKSLSKPNKKTGKYDRSPETLARVAKYCLEGDVYGEEELHERIGFLPSGERSVWLLDQRINERGVKLDRAFITSANKIVNDATLPLAEEFRKVTGGLEFTQNAKVLQWVNDEGLTIPSLNKETLKGIMDFDFEEDDNGDDETVEDRSDSYFARRLEELPHVKRALYVRGLVGSASVKKLPRMAACMCHDDVARGILQYHGAGPGRWAGRLFQPQNFPRGLLKVDGEAPSPEAVVAAVLTGDWQYLEMLYGPAVQAIVSSLRHAIIPREGRLLCAGDFSTVELRVNLALAGQHDKTDFLANGGDAYIDMAQLIYKRPIDKKKDPEERQTGKNAVLGLGFQMGAPKFRLKYAKTHPMEFCEDVVRIFRKEWAPKITGNWYDLQDAATDCVWSEKPTEARGVLYQLEDRWLTARLPSGRKLWYFNPQKVRRPMPWDATDIRKGFTYEAYKMGRMKTITAFGGLLTENVVQALARDLMVAAAFKAEKNGFPVVLTVHDELVTEPEKCNADHKALEQIMADIPQWAKDMRIPVKAEGWTGDRYRK